MSPAIALKMAAETRQSGYMSKDHTQNKFQNIKEHDVHKHGSVLKTFLSNQIYDIKKWEVKMN